MSKTKSTQKRYTLTQISLSSLLLSVILLGVILLGALHLLFPLPLPGNIKNNSTDNNNGSHAFTQVVVDRHQRPLRAFPDGSGIWRYPITIDQVSPDYINAVLGYEDRWFYYHPGINPFSIIRAAVQNWRCDCIVSGGSTITMQVARRLDPHARSFGGKIRQAFRALQLEFSLSKDEILTLYLNYVPMGGVIEGVEAASRLYLEKSAAELSMAEGALMAVLPQAPSRLRPDRYPQRAQVARNKVLRRLRDFNDITQHDYERALLEPVIAYQPDTPMLAPLLARELRQKYPDHAVIQTTIERDLQYELQSLVSESIRQFPAHHSAAILIVDNTNSEVLAYVGSADITDNSRFGHVDMVQAIRSPGSTLKPFIYGLAIDDGLIHSASLLRDVPRNHQGYQPENFARSFSGPVDTRTALHQSLNLPAVQVLSALTPERFVAALHNVKTPYVLPNGATPNLSLALGGGGFNLWNLTTLYSALANGGQVRKLKTTLDTSFNASLRKTARTHPVTPDTRWLFSEQAAFVVSNMLRNSRPNRTRSYAVHHEKPGLAWKTGTSYGFRDAWAVGLTPRFTIAVWLGRPDGTPAPGHFGAVSALPLLFQLHERLDPSPVWPEMPDGVEHQAICWPLGKLASDTAAEHCHKVYDALIVNGQVPPTLRDTLNDGIAPNPITIQVDNDGRLVNPGCDVEGNQLQTRSLALWPSNLQPWLPRNLRLSQQLPVLNPACSPPALLVEPLLLTGIEESQSVMASDNEEPSTPSLSRSLSLSTTGGFGHRDWFLNGRYQVSSGEEEIVQISLTEMGPQELVVLDAQGDLSRVSFNYVSRH